MPDDPVDLTVHRNERTEAKAKEMLDELHGHVSRLPANLDEPVVGYTLIVWSANGEAVAWWDGDDVLGPVHIEDHAYSVLRRSITAQNMMEALGGTDVAE